MRKATLIATLILATTLALGQNETVLYNFQGGTDGAQPMAGLIADQAGNLYGTTSTGGTYSSGVVFEVAPPSAPRAVPGPRVFSTLSMTAKTEPILKLV